MNDDGTKKTQNISPVAPVAPLVKGEKEIAGTSGVRNEIVKDQEVRDAGVVETPAPELSPPVQISEGLSEIQPITPLAPQSIGSTDQTAQQEPPKEPVVIDFDTAVKILRENKHAIPLGEQGSGVFESTIVVKQDTRTEEMQRKATQAIPKAA